MSVLVLLGPRLSEALDTDVSQAKSQPVFGLFELIFWGEGGGGENFQTFWVGILIYCSLNNFLICSPGVAFQSYGRL